jgi:hypothetical protein
MSIKLYDKVTLYGKKRDITKYNDDTHTWDIIGEQYDYYVADANDKNQNKTGANWSSTRREAGRDENGRYIYEDVPSTHVYTTENKDFKLAINMSAGGSSQGGKLSFWMCKFTKTLEDGTVIEGNIGINQEELKDLLKESTFINGVCQEPVAFYRISGNVGICTMTGEKYQQALKDKAEYETLKKAKKTTKWELGRVYKTKTMRSFWIGDVIHPTKGKVHVLVNDYYIDKPLKYICENASFEYVDKFPSRVATDKVMDVSDFDKLFDKAREEDLKAEMSNGVFYSYHIEDGFCYVNGLDKDLVRIYLLYAITRAMERRIRDNVTKLFYKIEDICEHFDLNYDELYQEAYYNKDTMKYKVKRKR